MLGTGLQLREATMASCTFTAGGDQREATTSRAFAQCSTQPRWNICDAVGLQRKPWSDKTVQAAAAAEAARITTVCEQLLAAAGGAAHAGSPNGSTYDSDCESYSDDMDEDFNDALSDDADSGCAPCTSAHPLDGKLDLCYNIIAATSQPGARTGQTFTNPTQAVVLSA